MDKRIKIQTRKMRDRSYQSEVYVNDEFYASSRSNNREETIRTAQHYAMQIEFDEGGTGDRTRLGTYLRGRPRDHV